MKFRGLFEGNDEIMRRMIVRLHGLPPELKELEEYEQCYTGHLFADKTIPWSMEYDQYTGNMILEKQRKPYFCDPIGKEIIDTISAFVFGSDKFPSISFKTTKNIYLDEDLQERAIDRGDLDEEKINDMDDKQKKKLDIRLCNEELQKFALSILTPALLNQPVLEATRLALLMGRSIVILKSIEGVYYLEVINFKNVRNLVMDEIIPNKIKSFSEMYMFEDNDPNDPTKTVIFYYRRDFNEKSEILYHPIPEEKNRSFPKYMTWKIKNKIEHNFGFCPAVMFEAPNARSIFYGQVENIRAYIYLTNNIYSGLRNNMNPQWALLLNDDGVDDDENYQPRRRGNIWAFSGANSLDAIAPSTGGYDTAREFRKDLRKDILKSCRIDDIQPSNQQSGEALTIRMAPTLDAIGEYQICFGDKGLLKLCEMILNISIIFKQRNQDILIRNDSIVPDEPYYICSLGWGEKMPVTEDTVLKAVTNALTAYKGGLMDLEHAVNYIAPYFNVIDVDDMLKKIREKMEDVVGVEDAQQMYGRIVNKINKTKSNEKMQSGVRKSPDATKEVK